MLQNDDEITSKSKFSNQDVQFSYPQHPALSNSLGGSTRGPLRGPIKAIFFGFLSGRFGSRSLFELNIIFFLFRKMWFLDSSTQNHAEPSWKYLKNSLWDPNPVKLNQNLEHGHVHHVPKAPSEGEILQKTRKLLFCWLHKLRNTRGKIWNIFRKYLWNL